MIRPEIIESLKFFIDQPTEILIEFCKLANEYLLNDNKNEKKLAIASRKLEVPVEVLEQSVEALVCLLIDSNRIEIENKDWESLKAAGFSEDHTSVISQFLKSKNQLLSSLQQSSGLKLKDLDWRLDAKIASRSMLSQAVPKVKLKLSLNSKDDSRTESKKEILMEADPSSLSHIIETLEIALLESKTHRTRNFVKAFQH